MSGYGPCVWTLCPNKAVDAVLDVHLVWEGRSITKARVHLCGEHLATFGISRRMNLRPEFLLSAEWR